MVTGLLDYRARMYDPTFGRWQSVDPLTEKYYEQSPYNYVMNNPVRFVDPNGKEVVDPQGKRITFEVQKDGTMSWSKNATKDVIRIGNAMAKTTVGLESLRALDTSKTKASMKISQDVKKNESEKTIFGITDPKLSKNGKTINSAVITIYEGSFKEIEGKNFGFKKLGQFIQPSNYSIDDNIGATAVHESVHITDKIPLER